ncbi:MAG: hypothetical protein FWE35_17445 [Streptosporangiales bacterium]|nr:hypothetical protein [Streptosporangiales bacterium]
MSEQALPPPSGPGPVSRPPAVSDPRMLMFTGGPRLGWSFRDRRELIPEYREPKPTPQDIQSSTDTRIAAAEARLQRAWKWIGRPSIGLALILILLAACSATSGDTGFSPIAAAVAIVILCVPGLAYCGWCWLERDKARDLPAEQAFYAAREAWKQREAQHQDVQMSHLAATPEWGSVDVPPRRTDIFGGTMPGWEALLAVHVSSLLGGKRPVIIADLTGLEPAAPLMSLVKSAGMSTVTWQLPHDLGRSGIMTSLSPQHIASAIAEALHAGVPGGARTERATDRSVLEQLGSVLAQGGGVSLPRLAGAVRAALGQHPGASVSDAEREIITGSLFPPGSARDQAAPSLTRLNAVLPGLAANAGEGWPAGPASCTCLTLGSALRDAGTEILAALVVQWLTVGVSKAQGTAPAIVVAGADQITRTQLEQLADACDLRGAPATLLFRHLRDEAVAMLGGGANTAFMRIGNHQEAEQASNYLGRHHTFAMSSFTATRGTSTTSTTGASIGTSTSESTSTAKNRGWQSSGGILDFGNDSTSGGKGKTQGTSSAENEGQNWSTADGTNRSDARGVQRVYEYRVEPTVLQDLPELSLLLADRGPGTLRLRAVECDPTIITLPGATASPLPPPPVLPAGTPAALSGPQPAAPSLDAPPQPNPAAPPLPGDSGAPSWPEAPAASTGPSWPPDTSWNPNR